MIRKVKTAMEEMIDILDENGTKTGETATRKKVHAKGLWHKIIVIAVIDEKGKLLMQQRANNVETNPGKWDVSAAGHISAGQTSIEAAKRELFEEVGIDIKENELKYIFTLKYMKNLGDFIDNQFFDFYIVKKDNIDIKNIKMQESEVQQVKLCNLKEIKEMISNQEVVKRDKVYKELFQYLK